jgi:hypothetical protein
MPVRRSALVALFVGALLGLVVPSASSAPVASKPVGSVSFNGSVTAMVTKGSTVYVVGAFTRAIDPAGEHVRAHVAAVDALTGRLLPWHSRINGTPLAVSRYRNQLFVGGDFTKAGGVAVSGLARLSTATGRVSRSFRPRINGTVRALAATRRAVYVGGGFTKVNGAGRQHLAAVARTTGRRLGWRPRADKTVLALRLHRGSVYAGGGFHRINGTRHVSLVALRPTGAGRVRSAFRPNLVDPVTALAFTKRRIFAAQSGPGGRLVALTASGQKSWERTFDGDVVALAVMGGEVYAGGHWVNICNSDRVAQATGNCLDGGSFQPRLASYTFGGQRSAWSPDPDSYSVWAMARVRTRLAVGGDFDHFQGGTVTQPKFALFGS